MSQESPCLKVPKIHGQAVIVLADRLSLRAHGLEMKQDADFLYVPLVRQPTPEETAHFVEEASGVQLGIGVFQERVQPETSLADVLSNSLPSQLLASLPHALDVVGDIAILEIPPELKPHEKLVGEGILKLHRSVKTVLAKASAVSGKYRTREFTVIAGEPRTRTIHKEFGCQYQVDIAKAYFSPRLSHEHDRVASLVQEGETVVDMFAGVGPFAVLIGKRHPTVTVYAVDLNPEAYTLLKRNVLLNRVQGNVFPLLGDARQIVRTKLSGAADRVIMNLPESAIEFIDVASKTVKPMGGVVHFYGFVRQPDSVDALKDRFAAAIRASGRRVERFNSAKAVRETAPYEQQVVLDARVD